MPFIGITTFLLTVACLFETSRAACVNTTITNIFGEINYLPSTTLLRHTRRCTWNIRPPTDRFVFVIQFSYIVQYEDNDAIALPDGSNLPRQTLLYGEQPICFKYILINSRSKKCLQDVEGKYCPGTNLKLIRTPFEISSKSIPTYQDPPDLFFYTKFQLTYTFVLCAEDEEYVGGNNNLFGDLAENENVQSNTWLALLIIFLLLGIGVAVVIMIRRRTQLLAFCERAREGENDIEEDTTEGEGGPRGPGKKCLHCDAYTVVKFL